MVPSWYPFGYPLGYCRAPFFTVSRPLPWMFCMPIAPCEPTLTVTVSTGRLILIFTIQYNTLQSSVKEEEWYSWTRPFCPTSMLTLLSLEDRPCFRSKDSLILCPLITPTLARNTLSSGWLGNGSQCPSVCCHQLLFNTLPLGTTHGHYYTDWSLPPSSI